MGKVAKKAPARKPGGKRVANDGLTVVACHKRNGKVIPAFTRKARTPKPKAPKVVAMAGAVVPLRPAQISEPVAAYEQPVVIETPVQPAVQDAPKQAETSKADAKPAVNGSPAQPVNGLPEVDDEDGVTVQGTLLGYSVAGMAGSGGLAFSTLVTLLGGVVPGLFGVIGLLAAEFIGGHFATSKKSSRGKAILGVIVALICMFTEVGLAIDREDLVSRHEATIAMQQTAAGEAMEDCSPKEIPSGLGSQRRLDAEQTRQDKCNARNADRATRQDARADKAATKAGSRNPWELAALIGLALACSGGTMMGSAALTGFTRARRLAQKA